MKKLKKFLMFALAAASVISSNTSFAASYVIQPGDTLLGLAQKYGVSYTELIKANPGIDSEDIKYGFRIEIPERKGKVVQNPTITIVNPVPKSKSQPKPYAQHTTPTITIVNPVKPKPQVMQHTTPTGPTTGPTITIVEEDNVY